LFFVFVNFHLGVVGETVGARSGVNTTNSSNNNNSNEKGERRKEKLDGLVAR
jgi:hypothetical protein